jgi:hypothetical protein
MKLLTFLGVGSYHRTEYIYKDATCISKYAPIASCHFLKPDCLTVFLTEEAEEVVYPDFTADIPPEITILPVSVPLGKDESELWQIFAQISGAVSPGEVVAFDITHGLRAFPFLGLLAAAFLRSGLGVKLEAVLYGAFDVRDKTITPNRAPMFDLSPMLRLLEWASATDRFNRTGDSRYLASLLRGDQKNLVLTSQGDHERLGEIGVLGRLGEFIEGLTQSLRSIRTFQVLEDTSQMIEVVDQARPAISNSASLQPFAMLLDKVVETYAPLNLVADPEVDKMISSLAAQRNLINWYFDREQWPESAALAREWLVSWVMCQLGDREPLSRNRLRIERVLSSEGIELIKAKESGENYVPMFPGSLRDVEHIVGLWMQVSDMRNDFLHAGYRKQPSSPGTLIKKLTNCIRQINQLPLESQS